MPVVALPAAIETGHGAGQQRLSVRLEERVRIARELHDTHLQGFQGLMLRFHAVTKTIPEDYPARNLMENVLDRADEVLLEGRERVRDLRQDEISANELPQMLAACGEEFGRDHAIRFSLSIIGTQQPLDPTVGYEAYRIGREALANAFQHSKSSKIEVEITYDHSRVGLRIRDGGVGINHDVLHRGRVGHWGLPGMRERTQKSAGSLRFGVKRVPVQRLTLQFRPRLHIHSVAKDCVGIGSNAFYVQAGRKCCQGHPAARSLIRADGT